MRRARAADAVRAYGDPLIETGELGTALAVNCAIPLAAGASKTITIPQIAGGRVWFSYDSKLTFLLNPGPALVEPSVTTATLLRLTVSLRTSSGVSAIASDTLATPGV